MTPTARAAVTSAAADRPTRNQLPWPIRCVLLLILISLIIRSALPAGAVALAAVLPRVFVATLSRLTQRPRRLTWPSGPFLARTSWPCRSP